MNGVTAYASYVPVHRLDGSDVSELLGRPGPRRHRVVAGYDEDTTTMAFEAARVVARQGPPSPVWLATTRPAYLEKTNAALIHAALGLEDEVVAYDVGGAVRSGAAALRSALATGGLALCSDLRISLPESPDELLSADGAAALSFGSDGVIAEVVGVAGSTLEVLDRWRMPGSLEVEVWDDRFALDALAEPALRAAQGALQRARIDHADHVVVASANPRLLAALRARLGGTPSPVEAGLGFAGSAHLGLLIVDALDRARPGETILAVGVADGADAFVLRATPRLDDARQPTPLAAQLEQGVPVAYATYLTWRGLLRRQPPRRPDPQAPAAPPSLRDSSWKHALTASRCTSCGRVHMPPQRVCSGCGAVDASEAVDMSDRGATVATFTIDRLAYSPSPPVVMAVMDLDGGGRFVAEVTDLGGREIRIGDRLEPTFRCLATSEGIHNYFWKMRPTSTRSNSGQ